VPEQRSGAEDDVLVSQPSKKTVKPRKNNSGKGIPSEINLGGQREIFVSDNNIKYVVAQGGETMKGLSDELDMMYWQLPKYNDRGKNDILADGEIVYLQPKRSKSKSQQTHTVSAGESLRDISQKYGVKIKHLLKRNDISNSKSLTEGMVIKLR
jgi:LysM repeat protein